MSYYDTQREEAAARQLRVNAYLGALEARGMKVEKPELKGVKSADEIRVLELGGSVAVYRQLRSSEPRDVAGADACLSAALEDIAGVKREGSDDPDDPPEIRHASAEAETDDEPPVDTEGLRAMGLDPKFARIKNSADLEAKRASWAQTENGPERK